MIYPLTILSDILRMHRYDILGATSARGEPRRGPTGAPLHSISPSQALGSDVGANARRTSAHRGETRQALDAATSR